MTRKSPREIERILEDVAEDDAGGGIDVVYRDDRTGALVDRAGEPTEPAPDADMVIIIDDIPVMSRARAEQAEREILGPVEDAPTDSDLVRVAEDPS